MFQLTEDQLSLRDLVREFAEGVLEPRAEEYDKENKYPEEAVLGLAEMGVMGLNIPEQYSGTEMDEICKVIAVEEVGRCCAATGEILATQLLVNDLILKNANEAQMQRYLPMIAEGKLGAFALTEPGAGSDASALRTRAVKDGDGYILNGTKCFISNLGPNEGEFAFVIAVTDPEKGSRGGMTAFLVDRGQFSVGKTEDKMGIRGAAVSELILDDSRVPESAVVGKVGDGFRIAMSGLDDGRIGMAALSVGISQRAIEAAIKYSKERVQFKKLISEQQGLRWYIAEMATRLQAARLLTYDAAAARVNKDPELVIKASMAKYYASEVATFVTDLAVQIHGGYGYMRDYVVERLYRDARILRIFEGTSEIQKIVISREMLK